MDSWHYSGDEDEDGDDLKDFAYGGKDAIVFLIDGSPLMHQTFEENEDCPFKMALECVHTCLRNKVFSSPKDEIGLLLFGTRHKVDVRDFEHLSLVLPMSIAEGSSILKLENLMDYPDEVDTVYGSASEFKLHEALWQCQSLFNEVHGKLASRTVVLFTNQDDPHSADQGLKRQAIKKGRDLLETNIKLEVIPLDMGAGFEWKKFYRDMVPSVGNAQSDLETSLREVSLQKREDLLRLVRKKVHQKRSSGKLKFNMGKGVTFAVSCYNLVGQASAPAKMRLAQNTNDVVKAQRNFVHPNTGAPLLPTEMEFYQSYGSKKISFTPDEVKSVKKMNMEPGLRLFGFKSLKDLQFNEFVKSGTFIYPEEGKIRGSRNIFAALLKRCLERDMMPICLYKRSESSVPSFVALIPIGEVKDVNDGVQLMPPGFSMFHLPFVDDLRHVPNEMQFIQPQPEGLQVAQKILEKLTLKRFSVEAFENPGIQYQYRLIEGIALERDEVERAEDLTLPPYSRMQKKLGDLAESFKHECGYSEDAGTKRNAPKASSAPKPKVAKREVVDMDSFVKTKTVHKLKVDDLKTYLASVGESVYGKKKDQLVQTVYDFFNIMKQ